METDRQIDGQMDGWIDGSSDGWTDRQTDGQTDGQPDRQTDGQHLNIIYPSYDRRIIMVGNYMYSMFILRKLSSPLRINGE